MVFDPDRPKHHGNPNLHAAKACNGYQRGVVIGDGGHRYRPPANPAERYDPGCEALVHSSRTGRMEPCGNHPAKFFVTTNGGRSRRCGICLDRIDLDVTARSTRGVPSK